jgi:glucose-6-phosphate 1-epimerase
MISALRAAVHACTPTFWRCNYWRPKRASPAILDTGGAHGSLFMLTRSARGLDGAVLDGTDLGGQLLHWRSADGVERLFYASHARIHAGKPTRGGVPVIFPQFGTRGDLPRHGLVRATDWRALPPAGPQRGIAELGWSLESSAATRTLWPHDFSLHLSARASGLALAITLDVTNTGSSTFSFTAALHTYLACRNVEALELRGLVGCTYEDHLQDARSQVAMAGPLRFNAGGIDRIYFDTPSPLVLSSESERVGLYAEGLPDTVVWNPGPEKAAALPDLGELEWRHFLCVEAAVVQHPVVLLPGTSWRGRQLVEVL